MPTIEQIEALLSSEPDDVFLNFGLAMALSAAGQREQAIERFDRVLALDPAYVAAYFHKARTQAETGQIAGARTTLEAGIRAAERVGNAHAQDEMAGFLSTLA